ncbi:CHAT domain-containing tetratricopeptide repeat protein [Fortiea contorta]|uniref:CHAT domain-containing tetratricopeptide repeat protein n=1 Tax=Fortiea contorta TaxID=1892405 RepID=UPI00034DC0F6|nr:CHAT domain-containing protein [Fortiea contorta]
MNKITKFQHHLCCSFSRVSRYGLTGLMVVILLSDAVGAKVGNLQNYSPKISPEILLDKYRDNLPSLADGDEQVLLRSYQNQQQIYIAQQPASSPSIPLNAEQQKLYQQGVKLVQEAEELEKKETREASEQAINKYQQALKIAQKLGLREEEVNILAYIANLYNFIDDYKTTIEYLQQALKISRELKKPLIEATLLASIGINYNNINEPKEGLTYLEKAKSIFLANQENRGLASTFNSIATIHMRLGDTKKALNYRNEALKLYREPLKDLAGEAYTLWRIAAIYSLSSEPKTALDYYEQALKIQRQRNDFKAEVEIICDIAALQDKLGNAKNAVESLKEALKLQQQAGFNLSDQANTIADIGEIYAGQADYRTAIDYYQQAGKLFQQAGNTRMLSRTFVMIANVHRNFSGNYEKALEFVDKALELQIDDKDNYAFTLGQKADIYLSQANYQKALDEYNKALELQRSIPNSREEARILRDIAYVYRNLGDYKLSLETYNKALDIYKLTPNKTAEIRTLNSIASLYEWQDKYNEALQYYQKVLSLLNKDDYQSEIQVIWGMTETYTSLKDYPKALELANRALKLSKENSYYEEFSVYALATVYRAKGDYQKSLDISHDLLAHYRKARLRIREAQMLGDMSVTYELQKNYQQAINILNEELKIRRELKESKAEANALYGIAVNQRKLENLEAALPNIKAAINIVENIRGNVQSDELRTSYFATVQNYYKFYIDLLMQLHKKDPSKAYNAQALHISERSRARVLVELLKAGNVNLRRDVEPQLLAEESRLQIKLKVKETLLSNLLSQKGSSTQLINKTNQEITNILQESQNLTAKIRAKNPERAELTNPQDILQLPGIQQQLDKDTILLQYSLGKERSYLWVVTPNSLESYELPGQEEIVKVAKQFNNFVKEPLIENPKPADIAEAIANTEKAADELSQIILKPVAGKLGNKRLVIVADGILHQVSFAALNEPIKSPTNNEYQPLVVNHEIVNLPSISSLATHRKKLKTRNIAPKTLAVLANPVFSAEDTRLKNEQPSSTETNLDRSALETSLRNIKQSDLIPLPGTKAEGEAILGLVNSPQEKLSAFDFDANYNFATSKQLRQYRYVLFATHGIFNSVNPALSGIVLSLVDKQGKPQTRSFLRLNDIFNLDLPAELIVLSACQSGLGENVQGEGLVGLTRGFMYAGAARVAVSLWNVNDQSTKELMIAFYQQMLSQNTSPAAALNVAQRQMWLRKDSQYPAWRHPRYWAAFTLQGEWR